MNLQLRWDFYKAQIAESKALKEIRPLILNRSAV
jgi:hypothetical protein